MSSAWDGLLRGLTSMVGLLVVGLLFWPVYYLVREGIDGFLADRYGVTGTVRVSQCEHDESRRGPEWTCEGPFTSLDGTVRISRVEFAQAFYEDPRAGWQQLVLQSRVRGPRASHAYPLGHSWQPAMIVGGFGLVVVGFFSVSALFLSQIDPRKRRGDPGRRRSGRPKTPRRWGKHKSQRSRRR